MGAFCRAAAMFVYVGLTVRVVIGLAWHGIGLARGCCGSSAQGFGKFSV